MNVDAHGDFNALGTESGHLRGMPAAAASANVSDYGSRHSAWS